jgi:hypothetical protein
MVKMLVKMYKEMTARMAQRTLALNSHEVLKRTGSTAGLRTDMILDVLWKQEGEVRRTGKG